MLSSSVIRRSVDGDTFRRGAAYAEQGRVSDISYSRKHGQLVAAVQGSAARPYAAVAEFDDRDLRWWGECSCPVGLDCKHVAAVLIAAGQAAQPAPSGARTPGAEWERALADLVASDRSPGSRKGTPLGLQFDVEAPRGGSVPPGRSVRLRPVVPGAKGRWIRSGVSWRALQHDHYSQRDRAQAAALRALHRAHQAAGDAPVYYGYGSGDAPVWLEDFGPTLWPALQQVVDEGVTLITTSGAPRPARR